METMENLRERLEALENQAQAFAKQMRAAERRLHCWRIIACGVAVLGVLSWALASGEAQEELSAKGNTGLAHRVAALERLLKHFSRKGNEVFITGANLHIVNGLGDTETTNGLGNLIVGYNESRQEFSSVCSGSGVHFCSDIRTGSHNVVVGRENNFSSFGGSVVGLVNEIRGQFASVSGGHQNTASGQFASVSGGANNTASNFSSSVSAGVANKASGFFSSISGGNQNTASGAASSISGGAAGTASGLESSVSGGISNVVTGDGSWVGGGFGNQASGSFSAVSGGLENTTSGQGASVSGGQDNTASGQFASVSGGLQRTAPGQNNWAAGPLFAAQ